MQALRFYGAASNFQYDRYEYCFPSHEPTESSFMPMHSCSNSNTGHDSWRHLYSSDRFVDWLLAHRLAESDRWCLVAMTRGCSRGRRNPLLRAASRRLTSCRLPRLGPGRCRAAGGGVRVVVQAKEIKELT